MAIGTFTKMSSAGRELAERHHEQHEDQRERDRDDDRELLRGALQALVLPCPLGVVADRQLHVAIERALRLLDERADVATAHVELRR